MGLRLQEAWAGVALGILTGLLTGLSTSEVVSGVLGAVTAVIGGFLALNEGRPNSAPAADNRALRTMAFCSACCVALLIGITARSHGWFGRSPITSTYQDFMAIGVEPANARAKVLETFTPATAEAIAKGQRGELYTQAGGDLCPTLDPTNYKNSVDNWLTSFEKSGGGWTVMAGAIKQLGDQKNREALLTAYWSARCQNH